MSSVIVRKLLTVNSFFMNVNFCLTFYIKTNAYIGLQIFFILNVKESAFFFFSIIINHLLT